VGHSKNQGLFFQNLAHFLDFLARCPSINIAPKGLFKVMKGFSRFLGKIGFLKIAVIYSIPDKSLGRSPNFSLDVQEKSWTPLTIFFSETL
jgi:hypothetical protein